MELKQNDSGLSEKQDSASVKSLMTVAIVIMLTVLMIGIVSRLPDYSELRAQTAEQTIPTVTVVSPKSMQHANSMALPAEIKPEIEAPIYARASGYLKRRLVDMGDNVKRGQLLAEIDTPELDRELDRARGQLAQAEASLWLAKVTAARWTDLSKTASVSEQETVEKQADFKLKTAIAESAHAEVRRLEQLKSFASVRAPFGGKVTVRNVDVGDLVVAASGKELFHLAQTMKLRVYVQVPQVMARSITPGQSAKMTLPELPGRAFRAKVVRTAGVISSDSRTLLVELQVKNPKGEILAGGYAEVRFTEAKTAPVLTVPANTLMFRADGTKVGVVRSDGKVDLRKVKIGRDFGQTVEIVSGLSREDRVIVNPGESLMSGSLVSVSEPGKMIQGK